jgi:hypothetical protein
MRRMMGVMELTGSDVGTSSSRDNSWRRRVYCARTVDVN